MQRFCQCSNGERPLWNRTGRLLFATNEKTNKKIKFRKLTTKLLDYKAKLIKLINNRFKMNEATSSKIETE